MRLEYRLEVHRPEEAWVLTMPSGLELRKVLEQLNRGLAALAAEAERHTCLVLRMFRVREECGAAADASAADRAARGRCQRPLEHAPRLVVNQAREGRFTSLNTRVPVGSGTRLTRDRLERHSCRVWVGNRQTSPVRCCARVCDRVCPSRVSPGGFLLTRQMTVSGTVR